MPAFEKEVKNGATRTESPINEYGFLQDIIPDELDTIYITTDTVFSLGDFTIHQHESSNKKCESIPKAFFNKKIT